MTRHTPPNDPMRPGDWFQFSALTGFLAFVAVVMYSHDLWVPVLLAVLAAIPPAVVGLVKKIRSRT